MASECKTVSASAAYVYGEPVNKLEVVAESLLEPTLGSSASLSRGATFFMLSLMLWTVLYKLECGSLLAVLPEIGLTSAS